MPTIRSIAYLRGALLSLICCLTLGGTASGQATGDIRLNQVGYYPEGPKQAVVVDAAAGPFYVISAAGDTVYTGSLGQSRRWAPSDERVRLATFDAVTTPGRYRLDVPGVGPSYAFDIAPHVHADVLRDALRGYYYQRTGLFLHPRHASNWARAAGHPDTEVRVHASAATAERPEGTVIAAPRGWYDAGDFNKYVVNSGITVYTLLAAYEHFPALFDALDANLPESGNAVPDVLDEVLWNLRWMMTMQDTDGGVYHKLTHANFQGVMMPAQATAPRWVVQKSTAATLDFTAVAAQGSRIFAAFPDALPGLADSLRTAALAAWDWADAHPNVVYNQDALNVAFNPDITTGEYGDNNLGDEARWAAAELYILTGEMRFLITADGVRANVPWWADVEALGLYSLVHHRTRLTAAADTAAYKQRLLAAADALLARPDASAYGVVMGAHDWEFVWGSNAVAANQAMLLLQAHRLTGDRRYADAALTNLDYLLGRNALGLSFLTGHGSRSPMHPHHRQSEADGVFDPVPGLLVGGPNGAQQDDHACTYATTLPALSYVDDFCSYASNEIAINWNAPLVYLAAALEGTYGDAAGTATTPDDRATLPDLHVFPPAPHPFSDTARVRFTLAAPTDVRVRVVDMLGRAVQHFSGPHTAGTHEAVIEAADWPSGLYFLTISTPTVSTTRSLVVAR